LKGNRNAGRIWPSLVYIALTPWLLAQEALRPPATPDTLERGHQFFANNCGICHGFNAQGGDKGPRLDTGDLRHGRTDAELFYTITHGLAGTIMPANNLPAEQVWHIVTYLRSKVVAAQISTGGNSQAGEKIFWDSGKCASCHMVNGRGGVLGADLSHIAKSRTVQYLTTKIRNPNTQITSGLMEPNADYVVPIQNSTAKAIRSEGQRIVGMPKNEDTYSVQMLGSDNEIHLFLKKDLKDVIHEQKSLMPVYTEKDLSDAQIKDLLAYLATLK